MLQQHGSIMSVLSCSWAAGARLAAAGSWEVRSPAHLSAQAEAEAVGKARGHVVEHACAVDLAQELLRPLLVLCGVSKDAEFGTYLQNIEHRLAVLAQLFLGAILALCLRTVASHGASRT